MSTRSANTECQPAQMLPAPTLVGMDCYDTHYTSADHVRLYGVSKLHTGMSPLVGCTQAAAMPCPHVHHLRDTRGAIDYISPIAKRDSLSPLSPFRTLSSFRIWLGLHQPRSHALDPSILSSAAKPIKPCVCPYLKACLINTLPHRK